MSRYDEYMPSTKYAKDFSAHVVKSLSLIHIFNCCPHNTHTAPMRTRIILIAVVSCLLNVIALLPLDCIVSAVSLSAHVTTAEPTATSQLPINSFLSGTAYAADNSQNSGIVATDSITDTENLLGDSVTKVSDMIAETKKRTGVTVKLLYLSTFGNTNNPSQWASDLLTSTLPARNTVLLAVATHDGRLVVAVSPNSDEWLKSKRTADMLSDAAYRPLVSTSGSHWDQSAIMMMQQIIRSKRTATTTSASLLSTLVMLVILLVLCVMVTILLLRKRYIQRQILTGKRKARRRHARHR
ncbi:hypothetical protein AXE77_00935 [Gardnerella vaginalis]|uniref:TPM domain-containing protein n=2 Tax=Gardnerella vaginalis TaxID=2702 RepID=A0A3E1J176_GARVA|nr:hypothetical protein AXE77_00935 [Gardnerella vaginalis]